jgi:glutathione S-transferase
MPCADSDAVEGMKKLMEQLEKILVGHFLKTTPFALSHEPTIADFAIVPPLMFIESRPKFYAHVPQAVKDYRKRVEEAVPELAAAMKAFQPLMDGAKPEALALEPGL